MSIFYLVLLILPIAMVSLSFLPVVHQMILLKVSKNIKKLSDYWFIEQCAQDR